MSYIGNPIVSTDFPKDTFSGNGATVAFTMSIAPASVNSVLVIVSGITQSPDTYTISGTTLTFSAAPPTGTDNILVRHLGVAGIPNTPSAGSVTATSLASGAITSAALPVGTILQVVNATYSTQVSYSTMNSWSNTGLSASITPKSATSKILVIVTQLMEAEFTNSINNTAIGVRLQKNGSTVWSPTYYGGLYIYLSTVAATGTGVFSTIHSFNYVDSPATTSSTTYSVQGSLWNNGTIIWQAGSTPSTITLMEIAA